LTVSQLASLTVPLVYLGIRYTSPTAFMAPNKTYTITSSDSEPAGFILPDLLSDCRYPLRVNPHSHYVSRASEEWLFTEAHVVEPEISKFRALRTHDLMAYCYPDADASHFRILSDFVTWGFMIDDNLDDGDVDDVRGMRECCISTLRDPINFQTENPAGKMCKSYAFFFSRTHFLTVFMSFRFTSRFMETAGPGCAERFIHAWDLFFIAVAKEVDNRAKGHIHNLESYTALRRDLSGSKSCFILVEYAARMDFPDEVVSHPVIMAMEDAANDYIAWSNVIPHFVSRRTLWHC
jgi:hypothetical protein